jgi:hypothetical protein
MSVQVIRKNIYFTNCDLRFCLCRNCIDNEYLEEEKIGKEHKRLKEIKNRPFYDIKKFRCCPHMQDIKNCHKCQPILLILTLKRLGCYQNFKDLIKYISSYFQNEKDRYSQECSRCLDRYSFGENVRKHKLTIESGTYPDGCDTQILFNFGTEQSKRGLILYRDWGDHFNPTVFVKQRTDSESLSQNEVASLYGAKHGMVICDNCVDELWNTRQLDKK